MFQALSRILWKLRHGWRKKALDRELAEEMQFHMEMLEQESAGSARREFGNLAHITEDSRANWGWTWVETVMQDLRLAFRVLPRHWSSTAAACAALALGVGFSIAVFTIVNAILLRPLHTVSLTVW